MPLVDLNKPGEKKKVIWAAVLGLVAIIFLWWTFFGFGSRTTARTTARATASPTPARAGQQSNGTATNGQQPTADVRDLAKTLEPIRYQAPSYDAPEAKRNIFAYYVPPKPTPK